MYVTDTRGETTRLFAKKTSKEEENMKAKGYITVDESGYIQLTDEGRAIATSVYERHTVITKLLEQLGVSKEVAAEDACKMEHVISEESFSAMKKHMDKYGKK